MAEDTQDLFEDLSYEGGARVEVPDDLARLFSKQELTEKDAGLIVDRIYLPFLRVLCGDTLRDYQLEASGGIVFSLLYGQGWNISLLMARQSGKSETVAWTVIAIGLIWPHLKRLFSAWQIQRFTDKRFRVGVYGPTAAKAAIIYSRIKERISATSTKAVLQDEDFKVDPKDVKGLQFPEFVVVLKTANPSTKIEGDTFDMIVFDEAQDGDEIVITKSLTPMLSTTFGIMVLLGTPSVHQCYFQTVCEKNAEADSREQRGEGKYRRHYQFDWTYPAACNPNYKRTIMALIRDGHGSTEAFRMAYNLEWAQGSGRFMLRGALLANGVEESFVATSSIYQLGEKVEISFKYTSGLISADTHTPNQVFAVDWGKKVDTSVMTVGRVWWDNPYRVGELVRYPIHVCDWIEVRGKWNDQLEQILEICDSRYKFALAYHDSTGVGDVQHDFLEGALLERGIVLHGCQFASMKSDGYKLLEQEWQAARVRFPCSDHVQKYAKHKRFVKEMTDLEKGWKGDRMIVSHPTGGQFHDDYPDSLMLLTYGVNTFGLPQPASSQRNPLYRETWGRFRRQGGCAPAPPDGLSKPKTRFGASWGKPEPNPPRRSR